ncbi:MULTISPECIES: CcoQ/FixQ family Cbb3-type cytochrome c oxidase assembly chaperone [Shewanella]|jgi:cytochrome c oxidase cbb3-type subunit 4|uniref:CcoQ/FixQ family Cbb3-type cytochrome c oxidase assembly chaperone n=2 Tax=Shewanella TaxID=22 RepID=A0A6G7LSE3_9GAMM|nr:MULTISPECIES: CcoQ/FixQ family Cbb3-type cytochrome c oxidase assembly chaperone [Shewanella]AXQ15874.1 cbb3-type cytochrome C oxidase subunit 3 [Shewanella algae]MBZ4680290.1 cbb3-type cytochrome oxidase subunit 3 [Shewanella sp.]MCA0951225.1 CcoQ/FixQ family Cbb3-type cytochrome c oxidase assembly chaperone [Shewanella chilikensis]MCE9786951.1 CcoQ/FixQ family Cbb3-type cytochrome c oxidase assembly chaperone [Shewanella chilikensis]MCE9790190.1 CcoQ/FixQ family Cbb3-type cytochrome c oxi
MDYGTIQGIITLVLILVFVGIFAWAYSSRRQKQFDEAANLVFSDEEQHQNAKDSGEHK